VLLSCTGTPVAAAYSRSGGIDSLFDAKALELLQENPG